MTSFVYALCQILNPWINQNNSYKNEEHMMATNTITNKFENHMLSIKAEHQKRIRPNFHHPTYNERHEKIIEMIDWTLERYRIIIQKNKIQQQQNEQDLGIINRIREELDEKRKIARNNITQSELRDEVAMYRLEETTIEDVLGEIGEFVNSGKL